MNRLTFLVGPTAVGKTSVGIALAERRGCEILSVDARQIYKHLSVGTAKPTAEECARVRHHLIDLFEPTERVTAAAFAARFRDALAGIQARGAGAIAVGGSGLYVDACLGRLDTMPAADAGVREAHERIRREEGPEALHARLEKVDPASAARLSPRDFQRVSRALEVYETSGGRRLSDLQRGHGPLDLQGGPRMVLLSRDRGDLYRRIEARAEAMLDGGLLGEIASLLERGVARDCPAFESIGYTEFAAVLAGEVPLERAREHFLRRTRRYAKRQLTWFRNRYRGIEEVVIGEKESATDVAARL